MRRYLISVRQQHVSVNRCRIVAVQKSVIFVASSALGQRLLSRICASSDMDLLEGKIKVAHAQEKILKRWRIVQNWNDHERERERL